MPIPWGGDEAPFDFGPGSTQPWIPQPAEWATLTVEAQAERSDSTLAFYKNALRMRRDFAWSAGESSATVPNIAANTPPRSMSPTTTVGIAACRANPMFT